MSSLSCSVRGCAPRVTVSVWKLSSGTRLWWWSPGVSTPSSLSSTSALGSHYFHKTIEQDGAPLPWRQNRYINYLSFFWVRGWSSFILYHWVLKHIWALLISLSCLFIILCCCCCSNCFAPSVWEWLYLVCIPLILSHKDVAVGGSFPCLLPGKMWWSHCVYFLFLLSSTQTGWSQPARELWFFLLENLLGVLVGNCTFSTSGTFSFFLGGRISEDKGKNAYDDILRSWKLPFIRV